MLTTCFDFPVTHFIIFKAGVVGYLLNYINRILCYYYFYPKPCTMISNHRIIQSQSITFNSQKKIKLLLLIISLCTSIGFQVQASYSCISSRFWHQGTILFTYGVLFFIGYLDSPIL